MSTLMNEESKINWKTAMNQLITVLIVELGIYIEK